MEPGKRETNICLPPCPLSLYLVVYVCEVEDIENAHCVRVTHWTHNFIVRNQRVEFVRRERETYAWFPLLAFGQEKTLLSLAFPESHGKRDSCVPPSRSSRHRRKPNWCIVPTFLAPVSSSLFLLRRLFVTRRNCRLVSFLFFSPLSSAPSSLLSSLVLA